MDFLAEFFNLTDLKDLGGAVELEMNFHDIVNIDVKRCRRSCLVNSKDPWAIVGAHDEIVEVGKHHDKNPNLTQKP